LYIYIPAIYLMRDRPGEERIGQAEEGFSLLAEGGWLREPGGGRIWLTGEGIVIYTSHRVIIAGIYVPGYACS
jgi:hypothetical protein